MGGPRLPVFTSLCVCVQTYSVLCNCIQTYVHTDHCLDFNKSLNLKMCIFKITHPTSILFALPGWKYCTLQ